MSIDLSTENTLLIYEKYTIENTVKIFVIEEDGKNIIKNE